MRIAEKTKNKLKHVTAIVITVIFLILAVTVYTNSFYRIKETVTDLLTSVRFYFCEIFMEDNPYSSTVTNISEVDFDYVFPVTIEEFNEAVTMWWYMLWTASNFSNYLSAFSKVFLYFSLFFMFACVIFLSLSILLDMQLKAANNDYGKDSKPLTFYLKAIDKLRPFNRAVKEFFSFCFNSKYKTLWLIIWLYNLNVLTIIGEAISYTLYFIGSFDFSTFYIQLYKLLFDSAIMFGGLPWYVWIAVFAVILSKIRKKIAYDRLGHMEAKNSGFVNDLGAVTVIYGLCGGGKGTVMTDIVLTMQKCYRYNAKETMQKYDLMFPEFPWIVFEKHLIRKIKKHSLYSLATIERYIAERKRIFESAKSFNFKTVCACCLFGYNYEKYGLSFDNNLYMVNIFEALDNYAKAFYIYTLKDFTISNYAIRSDGILYDEGNFPLWDYDYFNRNSTDLERISTYGKILDQDVLRKGKKVDPNNPLSDTLELGIVVITELDKERGNQNDTKEIKAETDSANQKNDNFNYTFKLDRHPSTVDHKYYLKILCDLQRTMKTEADIRESGDNLGVGEKTSNILAMPLFFFEEFLYGVIYDRFISVYDKYRFYHGDNTLSMYLIKKYCGRFINYYRNTYNLFGFDIHRLNIIKDGNPDGVPVQHEYYICYKKTRSKRYVTDSFVDYFRVSALRQNKGLVDYPEYKGVKATREELNKQNSYFIRKLENITDGALPDKKNKQKVIYEKKE